MLQSKQMKFIQLETLHTYLDNTIRVNLEVFDWLVNLMNRYQVVKFVKFVYSLYTTYLLQ